jgi:catechol 2,3-dioxygenase-like lactoylglutathione lyase family enzyme
MRKVPTDFRRVTMVVSDMETALTIYRDILGMEAYFDEQCDVSVPGAPAGDPKAPARLVILKCNDPYVGMLGLMQLHDSPLSEDDARGQRPRFCRGDVVFVLQHENVETAHEKLKEVKGVVIVNEPQVTEFPTASGGVMRVEGIRFFDPNGYFIDINQFIE